MITIKYGIKERIITVPEIELLEGSLVVSVKHHDAYKLIEDGENVQECWQVVWLEPRIRVI